MANANRVCVWLAGIVMCCVPAARAQSITPATDKFYVNVNVGGQLTSRTVSSTASQIVHQETATLTSTQPVNHGVVFDFGGGYRVWGDIFAGVTVSLFSDTETASWEASIPDPLFFNHPKIIPGTTSDLKRSEVSVSPYALWGMPLADKFDITLALGLAVIKVKQDLVGTFSVPAGTQNVTTAVTTEDATAIGPFAEVDVIYNLAPRYGLGGYVRYAGGKADLPSLQDHSVGGVQAGGGIRLRF